jgi:hypothetical protein
MAALFACFLKTVFFGVFKRNPTFDANDETSFWLFEPQLGHSALLSDMLIVRLNSNSLSHLGQ